MRWQWPEPPWQQIAESAKRLTENKIQLFWGSPGITDGLPFYLADARPLDADPLSAEGRSEIAIAGLLIACLDEDAPCQATEAVLSSGEHLAAEGSIRRGFLGLAGPPIGFHITVVPAKGG
jgi:hypothetical protein